VDSVGQRLKEERQLKGWSQRDLARETGVNPDTISGIETEQHEPRPSTLRKLAEGLGLEVRDFFREPAVPLAEAPGEAGPESEYSKEDRLEILRRIEMVIVATAQRCRRELEAADIGATDRKTTAEQLIKVLGLAFFSYRGAKQYVAEDEIVQEATEGAPEERRAARRVYAALTELYDTFDDIKSAVEPFGSRADSPAGREGAPIVYLQDRWRGKAS
jgi:transcriptional regulator with XRE-family HTH domain